MPIKLDCPRCKTPISVPSKKAGSYVACPRCQGKFWVPDENPNETFREGSPPDGSGTFPPPPAVNLNLSGTYGSAPPTAPPGGPGSSGSFAAVPSPVAPPPQASTATMRPIPPPSPPGGGAATPAARPPVQGPPAGPVAPVRPVPSPMPMPGPPGSPPVAGLSAAGAPPYAPPAPVPERKVARFVTAHPAESSLKVAADGKLPDLHLGETNKEEQKQAGARGMNPLVLFGLLALSVGASILLVMVPDSSSAPTVGEDRDRARQIIQDQYFSDMDAREDIKPYQRLLRQAQLEHVRRDYKKERQMYVQVLRMLRTDPKPSKGITGSLKRDQELEKQLNILLSQP